jgi:hypothetical protein
MSPKPGSALLPVESPVPASPLSPVVAPAGESASPSLPGLSFAPGVPALAEGEGKPPPLGMLGAPVDPPDGLEEPLEPEEELDWLLDEELLVLFEDDEEDDEEDEEDELEGVDGGVGTLGVVGVLALGQPDRISRAPATAVPLVSPITIALRTPGFLFSSWVKIIA